MNAKIGSLSLNQPVSLQGGTILLDPATIPAQTLPGGDLRIPVAALGSDLEYRIPRPVSEHARDTLSVFLRVAGNPTQIPIETRRALGPLADRVWPLPLTIPVAQLKELTTPEAPTAYELVYVMFAANVNPSPETVANYSIDKTPPYKVKNPASDFSPAAAAFPADLPPTKEIDEEYLVANPGGIVITLPRAANYESTDTVDVYWGDPADPAYATPVLSGVVIPASQQITIPISVFENSKEGLNTLTFITKDLPGNISRRSKVNQRTVRRLKPPVAEPPVVPLADGTGGDTLIDIADCNAGVTVEVPVPQPSSPNDLIVVSWQGEELEDQRVETKTTLIFTVDYAIIKTAYGATDGPVPTTVSYVMLRGSGNKIAEEKVDIQVDISYPGPVNPDEPDPVNPALELPRLVSSQGVDNTLDDNDYGQDAKVFIRLYDAPPTEAGLSITVWYDDNELAPAYFLSPGEEGTEIEAVTVPWEVIAKKPMGTVKLKWVLSAVGGNNSVWSREQDVDVNISKIELPKPLVQALENDAIACPTLNFVPPGDGTNRRNLKVVIPPSTSMVAGRTVTLKWAGYTDEAATVPIDGTEVEKDIVIPDPVPAEGLALDIGDYETHFKPVSDGFGKLTYTITGVVQESDPAIHFVFLQDNNDDYCEVANPIPTP
ncbi:hypothetical protein KVG96_11455 [Pseudomonas sp. COR58]|uniref:Uncharacterized protein n=1 Tax=Pseudomonas ekonensis TaxID=2842353 RepID=A0ABS6PEE9_9PSED|nr:hypothetical protein [Pseudomonas ekonensis]MBV4458569.1 hypothetical protein [Pseudomonas ekonensis]